MSSSISKSSSIPDLMKLIKHSFRECEFKEVEDILMENEKSMKMEMESLTRDLNSLKEENSLLEKSQGIAVLEKLKLEEKLQITNRECEKLKEKETRLMEELKVSRDRENRAEERYEKICKDNLKVVGENSKLKLELHQRTSELKTKKLESEHLLGEYMGILKNSDEKILKIGEEMKNLNREKSIADQTVEDLRRKLLKANQAVELLENKILEVNKIVEDLRIKKAESDESAALYKTRLESLEPRIMNMEEELASILQVKVGTLTNLADKFEKGQNNDIMSPGAQSTCNSAGSGGDRNVDLSSLRKKDATNTGQNSPGLQSGYSPHFAEINNKDKDNGHQNKPSIEDLHVPSVKRTTSSSAAVNVIEIYDTDDDEGNITAETSAKNKQKRTDFQEDSNISSIKKRKISTNDDISFIEEKNVVLIGESADSEEESCSDSDIEDLLASMKSRKRWNCIGGMLQEFNENDELVLDAVCALYRQQIRGAKSPPGSNLYKRIRDLAKYLIDGDSDMIRRKSVSEVKQQRPNAISECRRLAISNQEQLYNDPSFAQI